MTAGPYSRVYWCVLDDPKFEGIYMDDRAFATWVRLLIQADGIYPAPAPIPRVIHGPSLKKLVAAHIVDLVEGDRYRIHGMNAEREARSIAARNAARTRWSNADPDAGAMRAHSGRISEVMPSKDETRRDETSKDEQSKAARTTYESYVAIEEKTLIPFERLDRWSRGELDRLRDQRGDREVAIAIRDVSERIPTQPPAARQVLIEVLRELEPIVTPDRKAEAKEDQEASDRAKWAKEREATKRRIAELRSVGS